MVPAIAQARLVGYRLVVLALVGTGVLSFGLWVHHMFTTGLPSMSLGFFSAASMAVAIPSGIQVFAWIATLLAGRRPRITPPALFVFGFLFIFTLGGLTGVMVAAVPFDWQAHDSYFVVAHLHYVLIGGMVFPLFGAIYHWAPTVSGKALSEPLGKAAFWLMFAGFNLAFFPMHLTGLMGMPRRVYTYPEGLGWDLPNLLSTVGAFAFAAGVLVVLVDLALHLRLAGKVDVNPWNASSLEWLPLDNYAARSIPRVESLDPLWDQPGLREQVARGQHYLPGTATGSRETIVTSAVEARPDYLMILPSFGWSPWLAALLTAAHFLLLTVQLYGAAVVAGGLAIAAILWWVWQLDPEPRQQRVDVGGGWRLEVGASGASSHSGWAVVILMLVAGSVYASLGFAYFYYWTIHEGAWPPAGLALPAPSWPTLAATALVGSGALVVEARRLLDRARTAAALALLAAALALLLAGLALEVWGHLAAGLDPTAHAYAATVWTALALAAVLAATLAVMTALCIARGVCGILHARRRATFDCTVLLWHYAVAQTLCGVAVIHLAPWLLT